MNNEQYVDYLSLCFAISTTMFSSGLSILTLTISFITNKRDTLKNLLFDIQQNGISLSKAKQIKASKIYIRKMRSITNLAIYATAISFTSMFLYCLFKVVPPTFAIHILGLFVCISTAFIVQCIYKLCKWYVLK